MAITRPTGEQLVFNSSTTGTHVLDQYLEDCERAGKTLPEIMDGLVDLNGLPKGYEFRYDSGTGYLQYRVGTGSWTNLYDLNGATQDAQDAAAEAESWATNSNVVTVATNIAAITTVAGIAANVTTVANNVSGVGALASIAGLSTVADRMIYTTASNTYAVTTLTSFARNLLDDADAATMRSTLGLGTAATTAATAYATAAQGAKADTALQPADVGTIASQAASAVAITGGAVDGTAIGATTPSTGAFTTASASTSVSTPLVRSITGGLRFGAGASGAMQVIVSGSGDGTNYLQMLGANTGGIPILSATSLTDTNVPLAITSKGAAGYIALQVNSANQFVVAPEASAVNYLQAKGAATAGQPLLSAQGTDADVGLKIQAKGFGPVLVGNSGGGNAAYFGSVSGTTACMVLFEGGGAPSSAFAGAGILFVEGGALKYKGTAGTVTTLAAS